MATEAQITHATRKINNARKTKEDLAKNQNQLEAKVAALQQELATVGRAAERAQGAVSFVELYNQTYILVRGATKGVPAQCRSERRELGGISAAVCISIISRQTFILTFVIQESVFQCSRGG